MEVVHDLSPEEKVCPHDGHALQRIGEEVSEQLSYTPAQIWQAMNTDKKRRGTRLRFVLPRSVGDVLVTDQVAQSDVVAVLETMGASQAY